MNDDYRPIACGAYDELEVMAMHRARVELTWRDEKGRRETLTGRVVDTLVREGAEYLVLEQAGQRRHIRLDRILQIDNPVTGACWRQNHDAQP